MTKHRLRTFYAMVFFAAIMIFVALTSRPSFSSDIKFEKTKMKIGSITMQVEVADTEDKRERGLMNRSSMSDKEGMIFVFSYPRILSFWMKDTLIPLSIGFFDENGKLFQITDMEPASPIDVKPPIYNSTKPAKYALEVAKGWYQRKHIKLGTKMSLPDLK